MITHELFKRSPKGIITRRTDKENDSPLRYAMTIIKNDSEIEKRQTSAKRIFKNKIINILH